MSTPRPEHVPVMRGKTCSKCGLAAARHRKRARVRARGDYFKTYESERGPRGKRPPRPHSPKGPRRVIAIDGEGYTLPSGAHRYTYMAASDEGGMVAEVECKSGLSARQVFRFLCKLPKDALLVGFSLGYDRTKWVESWPDECVWRLVDPERRQGEDGPLPVTWDGYRVNLVATRMSLTEKESGSKCTVWDVWKFFQSSFVKALERWSIGTKAERKRVELEKKRRGNFKAIGKREKEYCKLECRLLATMVERLRDAFEEEGFKLTSWYGPGSPAALVLKEHGEQRAVYPSEMVHAVMCAYFGGRFECAFVGPIEPLKPSTFTRGVRGSKRRYKTKGALYAYDIASAYPAAMCRIPCLRAGHGKWVLKRGQEWRGAAKRKSVALCNFVVESHKDACRAWGPLPHRLPDGNIVYPLKSAGGWAWDEEVKVAQELHPGVKVRAAWVWERTCDCPPPFVARVRELYARRLKWGKAARGLVLKLILNSLYGKSAQRVGKSRYRCMVRAGLITSMTRAALLRAVLTAKDPWNVLELATDSVLSREPLPLESPGLGGWERKPWEGGVFLMRPGLRFALSLGKEHTAARGVNPRILHKNRARVMRQWAAEPMAPVTLATPSFFHGARLSVRRSGKEGAYVFSRDEQYGRWSDEAKTLRYSPGPKRCEVAPDGRLTPWELPTSPDCASVAYGDVDPGALAEALDAMRDLEEDQPEQGMVALL